MSAEMSPEERVERVRMALAEAGYPDARVILKDRMHFPGEVGVWVDGSVPSEVGWRAFLTVGTPRLSCWECWSQLPLGSKPDCTHDPLTSPWPEVVRP